VTGIGDQNGDGFNDILVCSGHYDVPALTRVDLYYGGNPMDTIPDLTFHWPKNMEENTLTKPASAGDFNGDGDPDFFLYKDFSCVDPDIGPMAFLYYGGALLDTIPDLVFTGQDNVEWFSSYVGIGDINADGFDDVCINVIRRYESWSNIYFGSANPDTIPDLILPFDAHLLEIPHNYLPGDLNGDGQEDFCVAGDRKISSKTSVSFLNVYFGGAFLDTIPDVIFDERSNPNLHISRDFNIVGDVNGDGIDDLAIATYKDTLAHIFYGSPEFDTVPDCYIKAFTWGSTTSYYYKLTPMGDVNADGFDDILTGSKTNFFGWGEVRIFQGQVNMDQCGDIFFPDYYSGIVRGCGADIGWCGDVNGDGFDDILFSVNNDLYPTDNPNRTWVYIYAGRDSLSSNNAPVIIDSWPLEDTLHATVRDTLLFILSGHDPYDEDICYICWYLNGRFRHGSTYRYWIRDTLFFDIPGMIDWCGFAWLKPGYNKISGMLCDGYGKQFRNWSVFIDTSTAVGIIPDVEPPQTRQIQVYPNYPNPFNSLSTIKYYLPNQTEVTISIYNLSGQLVQELLNEVKPAGYHTIQWDASNQSSGVYFYQISTGEFRDIKKCVLLK
jgi:hypothetical protein